MKIRGHRIELGDIESVLLRQPDINEAVVIVHDSPPAGKRLIAYLTGHAGRRQVPGGELREQLAQDLPEYMIPAGFVYLDKLPLTPNCKVDRKSLRALPVTAISSGHEHQDPHTKTEVVIAKLWSEMLGGARVGTRDRFDELGGDSRRSH